MKRLRDIACARSGDKGKHANIGVVARNPDDYVIIENFLTEERVQKYFEPFGVQKTIRYAMPNLWAFNFILEGILGEGGSVSLRSDAQGKSLGSILLEMPVEEYDE